MSNEGNGGYLTQCGQCCKGCHFGLTKITYDYAHVRKRGPSHSKTFAQSQTVMKSLKKHSQNLRNLNENERDLRKSQKIPEIFPNI